MAKVVFALNRVSKSGYLDLPPLPVSSDGHILTYSHWNRWVILSTDLVRTALHVQLPTRNSHFARACAQRSSTILYQKDFFLYQVLAVLAGLIEDGEGALYSYIPVGLHERAMQDLQQAWSCHSWITRSIFNFKPQCLVILVLSSGDVVDDSFRLAYYLVQHVIVELPSVLFVLLLFLNWLFVGRKNWPGLHWGMLMRLD